MIRLAITIILAFIGFKNFSQDSLKFENDILTTPKHRKGIYKNFNQFKTNAPGAVIEFSVESRSSAQVWAWGGTESKVKFAEPKPKKRYIRDSVWGISNGDTIFINNQLIGRAGGFDRLLKLAFPLSYFIGYTTMRDEEPDGAAVLGALGGAVGGASASAPRKRVIIIDMRTGELTRMNDYGIRKIFKDDKELVEKYEWFKNQNNNEPGVIKLVDEYNLKHKN